MNEKGWETAYSFQISCPVGMAYLACIKALNAMPYMSIRHADEDACIIEVSVSVTLWSQGEDIKIFLGCVSEMETRIDISSGNNNHFTGHERNRRNYNDLECAVRQQVSRLFT